MRPLIATAMVVLLAACGTPAIDDDLATDDVKLPDRGPDSKTPSTKDGGLSPTGAPTAAPAPEQHTLTVTLAGTGTVTSVPAGLTCTGTTCKGTFAKGTAIALSAAPGTGSVFSAWAGGCTGSAACAANLAADVAVTASFEGLDGTWTGTYTNVRPANGCTFMNGGNLVVTGKIAAPVTHSAKLDGLQLRQNPGCSIAGNANGTSPDEAVTVTGNTLTGTWNVDIQNVGMLPFPFTAKVTGKTMVGMWTCTSCTGGFTITKP